MLSPRKPVEELGTSSSTSLVRRQSSRTVPVSFVDIASRPAEEGGASSILPKLLNANGASNGRFRRQSVRLPNGSLLDISHIPAREAEALLGGRDRIIVHDDVASQEQQRLEEMKRRGDYSGGARDGDVEICDTLVAKLMGSKGGRERQTAILRELQRHKDEPSGLSARRDEKRRREQREMLTAASSAGSGGLGRRPSLANLVSGVARIDAPRKLSPRERYEADKVDLSPRLRLLPDIVNCGSANEYVMERLALLRQSDELRADFAAKAALDARLRVETKAAERARLALSSSGDSTSCPSPARDAARADEARQRRIDQMTSKLERGRELLKSVAAKQLSAQCQRDYLAQRPLLVRTWTIALTAWLAARAFGAARRVGFVRRWKLLLVLYCGRRWRNQTRRRRARIASLHLNFFIRKNLPAMIRGFRQRRMAAALPLVVRFLRQHRAVMRVSRVVGHFLAQVRAAQRFARRRRLIIAMNRTALQLAWDTANMALVARREVLMVFPADFRDRVIDALLRLEARLHFEKRRAIMDEYITALERSERLETAEQQRFMESQSFLVQEALSSVFAPRSALAPPGLRALALIDAPEHAETEASLKRRLVALYLQAEAARAFAESRAHDDARTSHRRSAVPIVGFRTPQPPPPSTSSPPATGGSGGDVPQVHAHQQQRRFTRASVAAVPTPTRMPRHSVAAPHRQRGIGTGATATATSAGPSEVLRHMAPEEYAALPMFTKDHPMQRIFSRVKRPRFPRRRFLATAANMEALLRMCRDAILGAFREAFAVKQEHDAAVAKVRAGGKAPEGEVAATADPAAAIGAAAVEVDIATIELGFLADFLKTVK